MALVVLLRGVNVGGHRTFRPSVLAKELARLGVVNVGAAGTFVVRKPVSQAELRAQLTRRLPFDTEVMIVGGADVLRLAAADPFAGQPDRRDIVRFVSVLARRRRPPDPVPFDLSVNGDWGVRVLAVRDRFVVGLYRRHMQAIGQLGRLDKIFGVPVTTRNWNTILTIARTLGS
jgi:uncharacterized protein (DUF1697 family)